MGFPEDIGLGTEEPHNYKIPVQETRVSWRFEMEHNTSHDRYLSYLLSNGTVLMGDSTESRAIINSNSFFGTPQEADVELKRRLTLYDQKFFPRASREFHSSRKISVFESPPQELDSWKNVSAI